MPLPAAVVADANVILSALIGGRAGRVFTDPRAPMCFVPIDVRDEVLEYLPRLAARKRLDLNLLELAFRHDSTGLPVGC